MTLSFKEYWGDVQGGYLDAKLTKKARQEEMEWILKEKVCRYCRRSEALDNGVVLFHLICVDTNKEDKTNPMVRRRMYVRKNAK